MDGFMDKLVGARTKSLESGIAEMRRLSHKCAEINELTEQLAKGAIERLEEAEPNVRTITETETSSESSQELKSLIEESFKKQEETVHQENVRVYRNVQAAIVDELKQQSEAIAAEHVHMEKKIRGIKPVAIIALVFSGISMCTSIAILLIMLGILPIS